LSSAKAGPEPPQAAASRHRPWRLRPHRARPAPAPPRTTDRPHAGQPPPWRPPARRTQRLPRTCPAQRREPESASATSRWAPPPAASESSCRPGWPWPNRDSPARGLGASPSGPMGVKTQATPACTVARG